MQEEVQVSYKNRPLWFNISPMSVKEICNFDDDDTMIPFKENPRF